METLSTRLFGLCLLGVAGLIGYGQVEAHVVQPANAQIAQFERCLDAAGSQTPPVGCG